MEKNDGVSSQPVNNVQWIDRNEIKPNGYNPNRVAPPELDLLEISIIEDGWTQPIVINSDMEIVDGFHRWTVSDRKKIRAITGGKIPVVRIEPKDSASQKMATIRHNRARGVHGVLDMAKIVRSMVEEGLSKEEIMHRLQMEEEEVIRLCLREGIPSTSIVSSAEFNKAWEV